MNAKILTIPLALALFFPASVHADELSPDIDYISVSDRPEISALAAEAAQSYNYTDGYRLNIVVTQFVKDDEESGIVVHSDYPLIYFSDETSTHQKLRDAVELFATDLERDALAKFTELKTALDEKKREGLKLPGMAEELSVDVLCANNNYLSLRTNYYSNRGGAHPNTSCRTVNFLTETGVPVSINQICPDIKKLTEVIKERLVTDNPEKASSFTDLDKYLEETVAKNGENLIFAILPDGVEFFFNPYDIAPYSTGASSVKLLKVEYKHILNLL